MGWNSWDCFGAGVNEEQVLANAQYMKDRLLPHGYNLITIDIQWYEPLAHTDQYRPHAALEMDGRHDEATKILAEFIASHPGLRIDGEHLQLLRAPVYNDCRGQVLEALSNAGYRR